MYKKIVFFLMITTVIVPLFSGCTTAFSRRQNERLEELERRVSKIEFENTGETSSSDDDLMKYRRMANQL